MGGIGGLRRALRWTATALAVLATALGGLLALAWWRSEAALERVYVVDDAPLSVLADAQALAHGRHLFDTRGCGDCHGERGEGRTLIDAGPIGRIVPTNITPAAIGERYDADAIAAAIRHGVRPDGRPLIFMPTVDYKDLSDDDTAALVAYVQSLPPSDHDPGRTQVGPMARVLYLFGEFPLTPAEHVDHTPRTRIAPPVAATVEYGTYVAQVCTGCHGADFAGGMKLAPDVPPTANLTPHADGLAAWNEADFFRALREGKRRDGSALHPAMPVTATARMTDVEISAMWLHFASLPPRPDRS